MLSLYQHVRTHERRRTCAHTCTQTNTQPRTHNQTASIYNSGWIARSRERSETGRLKEMGFESCFNGWDRLSLHKRNAESTCSWEWRGFNAAINSQTTLKWDLSGTRYRSLYWPHIWLPREQWDNTHYTCSWAHYCLIATLCAGT